MGAYNEAALAELSWRSFQMAERQANNQGGLDAVAQLFSKPENLGVPLQQFIESAESLLKENDLKAVDKEVGPKASAAKRAAALYNRLDNDQITTSMGRK